jgi:putative membrane-bound dehydrogenase-like protein
VKRNFNRRVTVASLLAGISLLSGIARAAELELSQGDHVCLVGNTLGERLQHNNSWEALLHLRYPGHNLVVRNLCVPGDEPFERLRTLNFGDPDIHLAHSKADVILFFFGFGESFGGNDKAASFGKEIDRLIKETKGKNYGGKAAPRMVFVSPIAFEDTGDPNLPDGKEHNARLEIYSAAMKSSCRANAVGFVDLFAPSQKLFNETEERLTLNGAHLNAAGYKAIAPLLVNELFGAAKTPQIPTKLLAEIDDKNFHWWHRYRAVNGYSIWGKRGQAGSDGTYNNVDVMERERSILDQMCANRDARIWTLSQGKSLTEKVDDSNTLSLIQPKTNVGGKNDPNRKNGKLGTLEYLTAEEQRKKFRLAPGYEINLFASEEDFPELANSVAMNFDSQGRMWVSTMPSYPQWQPKSKLDDKLLILTDADGDGRADKVKVFASGLHQPTGFEIGHGGAYVAQQPDVLFLKDTDGDDVADSRVRKLVGFCTADSHHGLAAFEWGPGGALYFQEGTFKQSQVESPYGTSRLSDAGVWRYEPRSEKFEVFVSLAFANPWGHVFDRWGQNFVADASPGFNYWATPISGRVAYPDKHAGGSRAKNLDWGGSKSKRSYPTFIQKRTRPSSGCEIVSSSNFPPAAQGDFLLNNVIGDRAILQHKITDKESGFEGEEVTPLVYCEDGNFRPVDLQFGPDGALYIVDWHNALIGHLQHNLREPNRDKSHGRIWRVTYPGRPLVKPPQIAGAAVSNLLPLLNLPEDRTRYRVRRELAARDTQDVLPSLENWVKNLRSANPIPTHLLLEALWVYQSHNVVNQGLLTELLQSDDFRARAAAVRVLSYWNDRLENPVALLQQRVNDDHSRVRLEAVRAATFFNAEDVQEMVLDALEYEMDEYLDYTLDETLRALDSQ